MLVVIQNASSCHREDDYHLVIKLPPCLLNMPLFAHCGDIFLLSKVRLDQPDCQTMKPFKLSEVVQQQREDSHLKVMESTDN